VQTSHSSIIAVNHIHFYYDYVIMIMNLWKWL